MWAQGQVYYLFHVLEGHLKQLFLGNWEINKGAKNGTPRAMVGLALGKSFGSNSSWLSNHCNVVGHVEVLDVEVGRIDIVRGC
jgi:hypothetical protein